MEYLERLPPLALRGIVRCLWALRMPDGGGGVQTVVPDGRTEIVLHLGEPFSEVCSDGIARRQERALAAGQLTGPLVIQPADRGEALGVRFHTAGAHVLFGGALPELTNSIVPLNDVVPDLERRLFDAVRRGRTLEERLDRFALVLARLIERPVDQALGATVAELSHVGESGARIRAIAKSQRVSARTLERRVLMGTGLSPRTLSRVLRFGRAFGMLDRTPVGSWTRVAQQAGYFDQAHMIREFRGFAGTSPTRFFECDPALARAFAAEDV